MQDQAFVEIGKIALADMGNKEPFQLFIQNMFPDKDNYRMILPVFELTLTNGSYECAYNQLPEPENVNKHDYTKYAYRKGAARGGDITFTTKFGDIEKKLRTLVEQQFKKVLGRFTDRDNDEYKVLQAVHTFLSKKEHFDKVKEDLSQLYGTLPKEDKTASGLSLLFRVDGRDRYLADFKIIQQILSSNGTEDKSEKYGVTALGKNAVCSICLNQKEAVYGFASPFKYATVDKPGTVSGFFKQANNWKNYPICSDCSLEFELGKAYVAQNLSSYFYKKAYYIVPKTLLRKNEADLKKALTRLTGLYDDLSNTGIVQSKEAILEKHIAADSDYYNVNLLFYEENPTTKAIKIKLLLEEILPSRFKRLFVTAPAKINGNPLYERAFSVKKEWKDLHFSFGLLKTFFEDDFYDLIHKVFTLQPFSPETLYKRFMDVIRSNYNKMQTSDSGYVEMTRLTVLKAHLTLAYFTELKLISPNTNPINMDTIEVNNRKSSIDIDKLKRFIAENQISFLDSDYKTGVFCVGILVRLLLNIQNASLGNTPFEKKLKGYNLNAELLRNVYLETLSKISQYQGFFAYENLRHLIEQYFILNINKVNKISNNELSFYFVAGIEFGNQFRYKEVKEPEAIIE